ncbi:DUF4410 domain-containing protein [Beijerinckia indica]|uniref:DUF4410 domain-containing protein n=1 Tax=Beijerinckia indica subsp. indica (strain ATCC 9039 / DSM 1715 / NCIMB 8712) TaxID=395963 RepID=B2ILC4_BEII9|nr:DUF4410 domain-containing protein [Beijerinckia indica]ACB97324.1 hypothetical protein Bind_3778 [Beijerinckia indica subsp. indica ATCC 9039]
MTTKTFARSIYHGTRYSVLILAGFGAACLGAENVRAYSLPTKVKFQHQVIYVIDFELQPNSIKSESLFSNLQVHTFMEQAKAKSLPSLMSNAIVNDLTNKGMEAYRLPAGTPLPKNGLLVSGTFLQINEGNRLQRAIIGFGAGHTHLQVEINLSDLSRNKVSTEVYKMQIDASSGKLPGAIITPHPYAAAAKYFFAGHDLDRNIMHGASKIAEDILAHMDVKLANRKAEIQ